MAPTWHRSKNAARILSGILLQGIPSTPDWGKFYYEGYYEGSFQEAGATLLSGLGFGSVI